MDLKIPSFQCGSSPKTDTIITDVTQLELFSDDDETSTAHKNHIQLSNSKLNKKRDISCLEMFSSDEEFQSDAEKEDISDLTNETFCYPNAQTTSVIDPCNGNNISSNNDTESICWEQMRSRRINRPFEAEELADAKLAIRKSDQNLMEMVQNLNFTTIQFNFRCKCKEMNYNCLQNIPPIISRPFQEAFWTQPFPTSTERRQRFRVMLENAFLQSQTVSVINSRTSQTSITSDDFIFRIDKFIVCEKGYLYMLGFTNGVPQLWKTVKNRVKQGIDEIDAFTTKQIKLTPMREHARLYILKFIDNECDKRPDSSYAIVPYTSVKQFYIDYAYLYNLLTNGVVDTQQIAGEKTFCRAFTELHNEKVVQLLRQVGSFATCEVCNLCSDIMRNGRAIWSPAEREVIIAYRRAHLKRQGDERAHIDNIKIRCQQTKEDGQPTALYLNPDGMTARRGDVPINKTEGGRSSKNEGAHYLQNRVIGVDVVCGDALRGGLGGFFLYLLDDFAPGGANCIIEVLRQSLRDTEEILAKQGWVLPKVLYLQFDNCGENKNKYVFTYLSALVELNYFDEIYINFLIVGHTHNRTDQYFSTLSSLLYSIFFCASPLALVALLKGNPTPLPLVVKRIDIIYEVDTAMNKLQVINKKIKYYQVRLHYL